MRNTFTKFVAICWLTNCAWCFAQDAVIPDSAPEEATTQSLADFPLPLESKPYQVRMQLASATEPFESLKLSLETTLNRTVGSLWQVESEKLNNLSRINGEALRRWTIDSIREKFTDPTVDVWYAVMVSQRGSQHHVAVRAWQPRYDWLSPVHERTLYDPREIPVQIAQLCWDLFRPEIVIEQVTQNDVRFRIPGGELRAADPSFQFFQAGDCLVPCLLYYDRDKKLKRSQELPWSFVRIDQLDRAAGTGTVLSGLRTPLAGKTRGKIEKVAVAAKAVYPATQIQLGVQDQPTRLLAGYRLEIRTKLPERGPVEVEQSTEEPSKPAADHISLLTDRLGEIRIESPSDHNMRWVFVYSGDLLLARVPILPGSIPFQRLDVPDDSIRLQVEGDLQLLQGELINSVAERNTLISASRAAAKKRDWNRVELLRKEIDQIPTKAEFLDRLGGIRVPAVSAAKARKDRAGQVRVERLCNDLSELINRYLDPDKLRIVLEELDELKKMSAEEPPP